MDKLLFIIYFAAGYWAVNQTIVKIEFFGDLLGGYVNNFVFKAFVGIMFGWALIPIAIIKTRAHRR